MCDRTGLKFDARETFFLPGELRRLVGLAARARLQSRSEFLRQSAYQGCVAAGVVRTTEADSSE